MDTISTGTYSLQKLRTWAGGLGFAADLYAGDVRLGEVINEGCGGATRFAMPYQARQAFFDFAAAATGEPFEPEEFLVERLLAIAELNRKRSHVVLVGDMDFFSDGTYYSMPSQLPLGEVAQVLASEGKTNVRVWDKAKTDFVPVAA